MLHLAEHGVVLREDEMTQDGVDPVVVVSADEDWVGGAEFSWRHLVHAFDVVVHGFEMFMKVIPRVLCAAQGDKPCRWTVFSHHTFHLSLPAVPVLACASHVAEE